MKNPSWLTILFLLFLFIPSAFGAGLDQYLVSRWDLRNGSLNSEPPGMSLVEGEGSEAPRQTDKDFLSLTEHGFLYATDINATKFPDLTHGATIWAKVRLDEMPKVDAGFFLGFLDQETPGVWKDMALALLYSSDGTACILSPYATLADGTGLGINKNRCVPVNLGEVLTVALVFDGASNNMTLWVNGVSVEKKWEGSNQLKAFTNLSLGRLARYSPCFVSFQEVRVYSIALTPEWIEELSDSASSK